MGQPPAVPHKAPKGFEPHVVLCPTRRDRGAPTPLPARSDCRAPAAPPSRVRRHAIRGVAIFEIAGRLSDVVQELDVGIQLALAGEPRGVICDLSGVIEAGELASIEMLATVGRHVRDWPGTAVAVACPDVQIAEALRAHPLGAALFVSQSLFSAITAVLSGPTLDVRRLQLTPHPSAPRAARDFVTRTLLDWQLRRVIPFASLVVSELVASSSAHAGTGMEVSVVWDRGVLRLAVADHASALAGQSHSNLELGGRTQSVLAALTRRFGVLPNPGGGKVVWTVLDAPRQNLADNNGIAAPRPAPGKSVSAEAIRLALDTLAANTGRSGAEIAASLDQHGNPGVASGHDQ